MLRTALFAAFVLGQATALFAAGTATLWWSQDLMTLLIHLVGEERALGANNVIRREDGSTLLTNPVGMILWMVPFWFLGCLQVTSALTLVGLWVGRPNQSLQRTPAARHIDGAEPVQGRGR